MKLSNHPLNLALRFLLEMIALVALGAWGWALGLGFTRYLGALTFPLIAAFVWGIFRVPGDASHSGSAPVSTPGWIRLILEVALFTAATLGLFAIDKGIFATVFACIVGMHYISSWDRILWLLRS